MLILPRHFYVNQNPMLDYTWAVQKKFGVVLISEDELFDRIEFQNLPNTDHEFKVAYAMDLGWRNNIDNGHWYKLKGY